MGDTVFPCKRVNYFGRDVPVLMQNENGPCPLLALSNVLLLRGNISIHADVSHVTFEELTSLIAEYMLERNVLSETSAELRANQQQNITDCMALFPKLNRGLDVNVRFDKVDAMEYSEDLLIFDLLHVRLLHGWLVDPQDAATSHVVAHLTYNQLVEKVIELSSPAHPTTQPPPSAVTAPPPRSAVASPTTGSADEAELQAALQLSMQPPQPSPPPSPPAGGGGGRGDVDEQAALEAALAASLQQAQLSGEATASTPVHPAGRGMAAAAASVAGSGGGGHGSAPGRGLGEAMVAQDWLATSSSQLTYHGLEQLYRCVQENELAVFFRNNHFSTLTKKGGDLYLLATDVGYLHERDIVWEKLNQIDGDTTLSDGEFRALDLRLP